MRQSLLVGAHSVLKGTDIKQIQEIKELYGGVCYQGDI